jgi:hypothetical protein
MSTRVQWRRGNTAQTAAFTGATAEITVDTDKNVVVVHDGVTAGGHPAPTLGFVQSAFSQANAAYETVNTLSTSALTNGSYTLSLNSDGTVTIPNSGVSGAPARVQSTTGNVQINAGGALYTFSNTNSMVFPDGTEQTTAYKSIVFNTANLAFSHANSAYGHANSGFDKANSGYILAQGAFDAANNVTPQVQPSFDKANAAFNKANTAYDSAVDAHNYGVVIQATANAAFDKANSAYDYTNTQIPIFQGIEDTQNTNITTAQTTATFGFAKANAAFDKANSAYTLGNAALPAAGGTISGSLYIQHDLTVDGTVTYTGDVNVVNISGNTGSFFGYTANGFNAFYAGLPGGYAHLPNEVAQFSAANNSYVQINFQNENGGTDATTDWIATANNGDNYSYYVDMGIAGNGYDNTSPDNSLGTALMPNDSYLYAQGDYNTPSNPGGNLVIGAASTGKSVKILGGGINSSNVVTIFTGSNVNIKVPLKFSDDTTQSTAAISAAASQVINDTANASFIQANSAFSKANSAYDAANTISGFITTTSFTTSSTAQVAVDSFVTSAYRSVKYQVQLTSGSSYHTIELLLIHNGTTVYMTQYGEIYTGSSLGTFDASISTGTLSLLVTPTNAVTVVKTIRSAIVV